MNSSVTETSVPLVQDVHVTHKHLEVQLNDGRKLSVPVAWYPRLADGSLNERRLADYRRRDGHSLAGPRRRYQRCRSARGLALRRKCDIIDALARDPTSTASQSATHERIPENS